MTEWRFFWMLAAMLAAAVVVSLVTRNPVPGVVAGVGVIAAGWVADAVRGRGAS